MNKYEYQGGCHCQHIRFKITLDKPIESTKISLCNCSMCEKTGYLHLIVTKQQVTFDSDRNDLSLYQFNQKIAKHYFCKSCGIKSFYQPRSHPDCWSINVRCLDDFSKYTLKVNNFDGKNWEDNIHTIT